MAQREAEIDGHGKARAGGEQRAAKRIEDGGVDQSGVRRQIVARDREVGGGGDNGIGQIAEGGGSERTGFRAEHEDGARLVLAGEMVRVDEVGGREFPGGLGGGSGDDPEIRMGVCRVFVRVATSRSSSGKEAARLARRLSSCSGGMAASRTRRPGAGGAEAEVMSEIGFAVAIVTFNHTRERRCSSDRAFGNRQLASARPDAFYHALL